MFLNFSSPPIKDANAREYKVSSHSITVGMNHRDEVIAIFATGGPLSIELMDQLMTYSHAQCMQNVNIVKDVVNRYTKTNL